MAVLLEEEGVCQEKDSWRGALALDFSPSALPLQKVNLDPVRPRSCLRRPRRYKVSIAASAAQPPFEDAQVCQSGSFLGFSPLEKKNPQEENEPFQSAAFSTINPLLPRNNHTNPAPPSHLRSLFNASNLQKVLPACARRLRQVMS